MSSLGEQMDLLFSIVNVPGATWDEERKVFFVKEVEGGVIEVMPLMYTSGLTIRTKNDIWGYYDRWCYQDVPSAVAAAVEWDPSTQAEPVGWHRHPSSGRRRPNGNPEEEYVNP